MIIMNLIFVHENGQNLLQLAIAIGTIMTSFISWKSATDDFDFDQQMHLHMKTEKLENDEEKPIPLPPNIIVENKNSSGGIQLLEDFTKEELLETLDKEIQALEDLDEEAKISKERRNVIKKEIIKDISTKDMEGKMKKKSLLCDKCSFSTWKNQNLNQHISQHHDKIKHNCDQCDYKIFTPIF